jgi:hypothetical protein
MYIVVTSGPAVGSAWGGGDEGTLTKIGFLHSCSCVVKTSFGHIPSIEQSNLNIFTIFYGPSDKGKPLYSVICILVSKLISFDQCVFELGKNCLSFKQSLSATDLGYGHRTTIFQRSNPNRK